MLNFFVATALGTLASLGVGGGSLLMLWLTLVLQMEQSQARLINLLFFLPGATISTLLRKSAIPLRKLWLAMVTGVCAAAVFSVLHVPTDLLKKLFGGLLILTGLREIFYRERKAK